MTRIAGLIFSGLGFVLVHVVFIYIIFWLSGFFPAHSINSHTDKPLTTALVTNLVLVFGFGLQHSGMARNSFKKFTSQFIHPAFERSVYVWNAVIALSCLVWFYVPIPITIWNVESIVFQSLIWVGFFCGWTIAFAAYLSVGIKYLLGLSQSFAWYRSEALPKQPLVESHIYKWVRNPQQLGLLISFWSTPHMTVGQLVFAFLLTGYIIIGVKLEERDLYKLHGKTFASYRKAVPAIFPWKLRF